MGNEVSSAVNFVGDAAETVGKGVVSGAEAVGGAAVSSANFVAHTATGVAQAVGGVITPGSSVSQVIGQTVVQAVTDPAKTLQSATAVAGAVAGAVADVAIEGVQTIILPAVDVVSGVLGQPPVLGQSAPKPAMSNGGAITDAAMNGGGGAGSLSLTFGDRLARNIQKPEVQVAAAVGAITGLVGAKDMTTGILLGGVGFVAPPLMYTAIVRS